MTRLEYNRLRMRAWRAANREKDREIKRRDRAANPAAKAAENKRWEAKNKERRRQYRRNRKALEKGAPGKHTAEDIALIYRLQRGRCAYCRNKLGSSYQIDHIRPLSKNGSNDPSNLQFTCIGCNQRKKAKSPLEFARSCGLLL